MISYTIKPRNNCNIRECLLWRFQRRYLEWYCVSLAVYITAYEYILLLCDGAQDVAERNRALWLVCLYLQCVTPMVCAAAASYP